MVRHTARTHTGVSVLQRVSLYAIVVLVVVYCAIVMVRTIAASAFLDTRDRINIVFYGEETDLLSLGLSDKVNYIVSFDHDDKVSVPGGYGRYRVGALGKLADLEKDPELVSRTLSSMSSAYVEYYVYPKGADVFEGKAVEEPTFNASTFIRRLFSRSYITNIGFFDKIYLSYTLSKLRTQDFVPLHGESLVNKQGETDFSEKRFLKKYKGFFYHQALRDEAKEVKILYNTSYPAAVVLSRVIEGQGIRVVDLSESDKASTKCLVTYSSFGESKTARYLSRRFNCTLVKGETEGADIILDLGEKLTEVWK